MPVPDQPLSVLLRPEEMLTLHPEGTLLHHPVQENRISSCTSYAFALQEEWLYLICTTDHLTSSTVISQALGRTPPRKVTVKFTHTPLVLGVHLGEVTSFFPVAGSALPDAFSPQEWEITEPFPDVAPGAETASPQVSEQAFEGLRQLPHEARAVFQDMADRATWSRICRTINLQAEDAALQAWKAQLLQWARSRGTAQEHLEGMAKLTNIKGFSAALNQPALTHYDLEGLLEQMELRALSDLQKPAALAELDALILPGAPAEHLGALRTKASRILHYQRHRMVLGVEEAAKQAAEQ
ncbi:hypothetical protein [Deinococcus cellulosilyticus]|uniref:Uncharacterized protein n=1 Tax=Deinococcus cellulosilyticus (strain DSM 18568 / NBRC 106333 / KACC 11606 / 5516J-15) TaxID=1223518 RepID=A0A511N5M3_DEIC1|nr:hypothetical protein [Deinococcus cellulosilyticus]GEM47726.1 hypothetical protein DC3_33610 [Deinococcus cellulosilyticus NBRC 106333 = KACC 11606]